MSINNALEYQIKNKRRLKRRKAMEMTMTGETRETVTALHEYSYPVLLSFIVISSKFKFCLQFVQKQEGK